MTTGELILRRPDDWHLHVRDGAMLRAALPHSSASFRRAIIMPNLVPPVTTSQDARAYRDRIVAAVPDGHDFTPLMTLYLTETTDPDDVACAFETGLISAIKLYPAGATTNSDRGVRDIDHVMPVLERMALLGIPLCVHGEVTDPDIDIFDREAVFIDRVLRRLCERVPELRIVMEHITTEEGVQYVWESGENIAATLTPHHLVINRNAMLVGGIRPHYYCLPVAKREKHRVALRRAAVAGNGKFFLGTDSAPHPDGRKESACGCAGMFTAPNTLSCLAHVFEEEGGLDQLEAFASLNGAAFYRLAPNEERIRLVKKTMPFDVSAKIDTGEGMLTVFDPGFALYWHPDRTYRADPGEAATKTRS